MTSRGIAALAASLRRLTGAGGLQLVRADALPVIVALLHTRFGGGEQILEASAFLEELDEDLAELRSDGFDVPQSAPECLAEWVRQGYIVRRPGEGREESVELAASVQPVVRLLAGLLEPVNTVTASRLATITHLLERLARETDASREGRVAALKRERDRIDAQIAAVTAGQITPLPDGRAREQVHEILTLAAEISGGFSQVSADFEDLSRDLRERIMAQAAGEGEIATAMAAGVDPIEESALGRSFAAFDGLVRHPETADALEAAVDAVLDRGFAANLARDEVYQLRHLLTDLQTRSARVRSDLTGLAQSLRQFVETREYHADRQLFEAIDEAWQAARDAAGIAPPHTQTTLALDTSSVPMGSVGSWKLHRPADSRVTTPVERHEPTPLDLVALRHQVRESEIDFAELRAAILATLEERPTATVGEVLQIRPPSQGLASVVGLLVLAHSVGTSAAGIEELSWLSPGGRWRTVHAPRYLFTQVPPDWKVITP
ncbi:MAG: DUF3375 domain-containing protein [Propioniciclava sp.]